MSDAGSGTTSRAGGGLRVLHLRDSRGMYGAERIILALCRRIDPARVRQALVCMEDGHTGELAREARACGVETLSLPVRARFDARAVRAFRAMLAARAPALLHTHDFKSNFYGLLASRGLPVRRVVTAHGSTRDSPRKRLYLALDERWTIKRADAVVAVSAELGRHLGDRGVPEGRIHVIPNGFDPDALAGAAAPALPDTPPGTRVFAVVGRLFPDKGHRTFLEAFERLRAARGDVAALIVGDGPDRGPLERIVAARGLSGAVSFTGALTGMAGVYARIDCLVIPSLREGLPNVLLEGLWCGVPVVATTVGEMPAIVAAGGGGYPVPPGDAEALLAGMRRCLENPEEARAMAARGRDLVVREYSAAAMAARYEALYRDLHP